jgi:hypothetical protein
MRSKLITGEDPLNHEVPHDLELSLAHHCVDKAFESYRARFADYSPTMSWASENLAKVGFNAKGIKLSGSIAVKPKTIELELEVPFLLRIFKNKALEIIEEEIKMWVGKAKAGQI